MTAARRSRSAAWAAGGLSALLVTTGLLHLLAPADFESIVPRLLGAPAFWVYLSGVAELACAAAIALPRTRHVGGLAAAALFVAVFPANVQMALDAHGGRDLLIAWGRLPLQIPLVAWALYVARHSRRGRGPRDSQPGVTAGAATRG